jgi:hypothetical protein
MSAVTATLCVVEKPRPDGPHSSVSREESRALISEVVHPLEPPHLAFVKDMSNHQDVTMMQMPIGAALAP